MPERGRVLKLIEMVESGRYVEAIEKFYTDGATMQENLGVPRRGRDTLIAHERAVLSNVKQVRALPGSTFTIEEDRRAAAVEPMSALRME